MLTIRKSNERGKSDLGWLDSKHTFSFAGYYDEHFMGFGCLRVINEDIVQANQGFGRHPHQNMEIISYVIEGALEHKDSLGTGSVIRPEEIQSMSAGTGIEHSEFNHSSTDPLHFLQIWITPATRGTTPGYEQKKIKKIENQLILIGAQNPDLGAIAINQDVNLFAAYLSKDAMISYEFKAGRIGWLQLIRGTITINDHLLNAGDGIAIEQTDKITISCLDRAELLLFDLV